MSSKWFGFFLSARVKLAIFVRCSYSNASRLINKMQLQVISSSVIISWLRQFEQCFSREREVIGTYEPTKAKIDYELNVLQFLKMDVTQLRRKKHGSLFQEPYFVPSYSPYYLIFVSLLFSRKVVA